MATRTPARPTTANGSHAASPRRDALSDVGVAKRSAPMAIVGIVLVILGAILALTLYRSIDDRQEVLVVARSVAAGQILGASDLVVARVSVTEGVATVAASQRAEVIGRPAAVGLVPGALLAPSQLGASSALAADEAVVGVAIKAGNAPLGLRAGTRVQIVDSVRETTGDRPRPVVLATEAVVVATAGQEGASGSTLVVSLVVSALDAPGVAAAVLEGDVSLVVLPTAGPRS